MLNFLIKTQLHFSYERFCIVVVDVFIVSNLWFVFDFSHTILYVCTSAAVAG